jgi:protein O-mannosyl-transferase
MGRLPARGAAPLLLVLVAVALAYLPSLSGGRVWDDNFLFEQNRVIAGRAPAWQAFREPYIAGESYYRPATVLALRGLSVAGGGMFLPRLFSLGLHLGLVVFVYLLARRLGAGSTAALVAAVLFGLHPALTEAVAWVSCLGDLMAAAWLGVAMLAAMRAAAPAAGSSSGMAEEARSPGASGARDQRWTWAVLSILSFGVALLCKEIAAVFPVICAAALAAEWRRRPAEDPGPGMERAARASESGSATGGGVEPGRSRAARYHVLVLLAGQAVVLALWLLARADALKAGGAPGVNLASIGPVLRLALLGRYVALLVAPVHLNLLHVIDPPRGVGDPRVWLGILGMLAFFAVAAWTVWRRPRALGPAACTVATLAPVLLLTPAGTGLLAERYLYIPGIGLAVLLAVFASVVGERMRRASVPGTRPRWASTRRVVLAVAAVLAAVSFGLVARRSFVWRSESMLFQQALAADPRAATAAVKLGFAMRQAGNKAEALALYERTLQAVAARPPELTDLDRDSLRKIAYEAALLLGEQGALAEAEVALRQALTYDPTDERVLGTLGALLGQTGRYAEARAVLEEGVGIHPDSKLIRRNFALVLELLGDSSGAATEYREILRQDPGDREVEALLRRGRQPASR